MRRCLAALLLGACATRSPVSTMPSPATSPTMPSSSQPSPTPGPQGPVITLAPDQRLALGGGVTVHFTGVVVEEIAGSPDGAYPAGSGVTLALIFAGIGAPERREISLLSAGYDSLHEAWFDRFRVTVVDVKDPLRAPRLELIAEQVSDRVRPGAPITARLERGAELALEAATMTFRGHSAKSVAAGESQPLVVHVDYRAPGAPPESAAYNVGPDDRPQRWRWRDHEFTITAHAYDAWMQLAIARLELAPI